MLLKNVLIAVVASLFVGCYTHELPEGWIYTEQEYIVKELGGRKSDKHVAQQVDGNNLFNLVLLTESSSYSKKAAHYFELAVQSLEQSENENEVTGFYKVKLSEKVQQDLTTQYNIKKFPTLLTLSGQIQFVTELNFTKDSTEEEAVGALVKQIQRKSVITRVECDEIAQMQVENVEHATPIVAYIVNPTLLHPKAGLLSIPVSEYFRYPYYLRARYVYNSDEDCPAKLGINFSTERIRIFMQNGQKEDIKLSAESFEDLQRISQIINQLIVNSSNKISARSVQLSKDPEIQTVTLVYDKNKQDVDAIRKFRKYVKDASFFINTKVQDHDMKESKLCFLINNSPADDFSEEEPVFLLTTHDSDHGMVNIDLKKYGFKSKYLYDFGSLVEQSILVWLRYSEEKYLDIFETRLEMYQTSNGLVTYEDMNEAREYYKTLKESLEDTELNMMRRREHVLAQEKVEAEKENLSFAEKRRRRREQAKQERRQKNGDDESKTESQTEQDQADDTINDQQDEEEVKIEL